MLPHFWQRSTRSSAKFEMTVWPSKFIDMTSVFRISEGGDWRFFLATEEWLPEADFSLDAFVFEELRLDSPFSDDLLGSES